MDYIPSQSVIFCLTFRCLSFLGPEESNIFGRNAQSTNSDPVTPGLESELHAITTVSPVNIPNHQPVFKSLLLHEHLLTRNFEGDQHFFRRDGSVAAYSTMPGSVSASDARDPVTQLVPHEDAPAFSDVATTATAAATSPLTTSSPTTPRLLVSLPQKRSSKERTRGEDKIEPTIGPLTTQVPPSNRGSASSQRSRAQSWSAFPAEGSLASTSVRTDKGEARETALTDKASWGNPTPPSREQGITRPS